MGIRGYLVFGSIVGSNYISSLPVILVVLFCRKSTPPPASPIGGDKLSCPNPEHTHLVVESQTKNGEHRKARVDFGHLEPRFPHTYTRTHANILPTCTHTRTNACTRTRIAQTQDRTQTPTSRFSHQGVFSRPHPEHICTPRIKDVG